MQIVVNGVLYESNDETRDQYVIRYFANKIVKYIDYINKEFKDYLKFNSDWDRIEAYDSKDQEKIDDFNKKSLEKLDKNAPVRRANTSINTSTSIGDDNPEPEMKLGHFSRKRFNQFLSKVNSEGETPLPIKVGKDDEDNPQLLIPMLKIINEKTFKSLKGLISKSDNTNLDNAMVSNRYVKEFEENGHFEYRSQVKYFYNKILKTQNKPIESERYPSDEQMYDLFKEVANANKLSKFVDLLKDVRIKLVTGESCGFKVNCIVNTKIQGQYSLESNVVKVPFFEKSKMDFQTYDEKLIMLRVLHYNKETLYSTLIHELTHAYDYEFNNEIYYGNDGVSYNNLPYEINAFTASLSERIEVIIRQELKQLKDYREELRKTFNSGDEFYGMEVNEYVNKNNFIYDMFSSFDNFIKTILDNKDEKEKEFIDFGDNENKIINKMNNDEENKKLMSEKLKPWYEDFKARYGNVLPSRKLNNRKPKEFIAESIYKGTCDRFRREEGGEDAWQDMMKNAHRISQRVFMKNIEIEDILDEGEKWKDWFNVHRDVKFYESPNYYFMQTMGFEYIWMKEPELEDII